VIPAADEDKTPIRWRTTPSTALNECRGLHAGRRPRAGRRRRTAGRPRSATTGSTSTSALAFGGFKQSGVGREGGRDGLMAYLETKTLLLDGAHPARFRPPPDSTDPAARPRQTAPTILGPTEMDIDRRRGARHHTFGGRDGPSGRYEDRWGRGRCPPGYRSNLVAFEPGARTAWHAL